MLTQTIATAHLTSDDEERGSGRVAFARVCGQCKFFDVYRNLCEGKLEPWEHDRSVAVRPKARATNSACSDRFIESSPF